MATAQEQDASPSIHVRLSRVMADVGVIGKTGYNSQQHFAFRGIDAVMGALHPALVAQGVFFTPEVVDRDRRDFTTKSGTQMEAVHLHVRFTFYGPAGDSVACSAWGEASDAGDKATGKAMSMALKSALLQTFCVPTEDTEDADATSVERGEAVDDPADELRRKVREWAEANGKPLADIATEFATATGQDIRTAGVAPLTAFLANLHTAEPASPPAPPLADLSAEDVEAARAASANAIRQQALDPDITLPALTKLAAANADLRGIEVTGRLGGTTTLGDLLDEVAATFGGVKREAAS